jgi:urease accessory protein
MIGEDTVAVGSTLTRRAPAQGQIDIALAQVGDTTRVNRSLAVPPLQLSRVRYDDPAQPGQAVFTQLQLGGVLAGDCMTVNVELGEAAAATIRGAASTQVLTMPEGEASLSTTLRLGAGSRLRWLPEPLILFAGSRYSQRMRVELGPGAVLILLDIFVPGRLARGEVFRFARYESRVEIFDQADTCLAAERALIEPERYRPAAPGLFERLPVLGSLYLLGDQLDHEGLCERVAAGCGAQGGAAVLPNGCGLLVRTLGPTPSGVRAALMRIGEELDRLTR